VEAHQRVVVRCKVVHGAVLHFPREGVDVDS
jgi:hypothetical protein